MQSATEDASQQPDPHHGLRHWLLHPWSHFSNSVSVARRSRISSDVGRREARQRAIQLLVENLSPSQREQYENHGHFDVIGGQTGKRYRIWHGSQMNVELLDSKGRCLCKLCFMPRGCLGVGDVMLAQKIALELFESEVTKVASKIPLGFSRSGYPGFWG
jgi:hypothetical protein